MESESLHDSMFEDLLPQVLQRWPPIYSQRLHCTSTPKQSSLTKVLSSKRHQSQSARKRMENIWFIWKGSGFWPASRLLPFKRQFPRDLREFIHILEPFALEQGENPRVQTKQRQTPNNMIVCVSSMCQQTGGFFPHAHQMISKRNLETQSWVL